MTQVHLPFDDPEPRATVVRGWTDGAGASDGRSDRHQTRNEGLTFVRHPRARRYIIRVRADGAVFVTIPRWGSMREAEAFAASEQAWVQEQRARLARKQAQHESSVFDLSAETERALRQLAQRELPARLYELASLHGLTVAKVTVRNQRWRWGSCSPTGHICLNWRLLQVPAWVRDYVLIHELMHLKRLDHSPRFWNLVANACPAYREARTWLRRHQTGS